MITPKFNKPLGTLGEIQLGKHIVFPDHFLLTFSWTHVSKKGIEDHVIRNQTTWILDPDDLVRLRNLFQSVPS